MTAEWIAADVFTHLRRFRDQGKRFDLIVLDPPKFAPTEKHVPNAARAYKDINLWAMKLLAPARQPADVLMLGRGEARTCSARSWPGPRPMRVWTCRCAGRWVPQPTTPSRFIFPRAST